MSRRMLKWNENKILYFVFPFVFFCYFRLRFHWLVTSKIPLSQIVYFEFIRLKKHNVKIYIIFLFSMIHTFIFRTWMSNPKFSKQQSGVNEIENSTKFWMKSVFLFVQFRFFFDSYRFFSSLLPFIFEYFTVFFFHWKSVLDLSRFFLQFFIGKLFTVEMISSSSSQSSHNSWTEKLLL